MLVLRGRPGVLVLDCWRGRDVLVRDCWRRQGVLCWSSTVIEGDWVLWSSTVGRGDRVPWSSTIDWGLCPARVASLNRRR